MAAASRRTAEVGIGEDDASTASLGGTKGCVVAKGNGAYDFTKDQGRFKLSVAFSSTVELLITPDRLYLQAAEDAADRQDMALGLAGGTGTRSVYRRLPRTVARADRSTRSRCATSATT